MCDRKSTVNRSRYWWFDAVKSKIDELTSLSSGWDGYGAKHVSFKAAYFSLIMLESFGDSIKYVPSIVPGTNGDLQIEWHNGENSIEIHVLDEYDIEAWRDCAGADDDGEEIRLTANFTIINSWLNDFNGTDRVCNASTRG